MAADSIQQGIHASNRVLWWHAVMEERFDDIVSLLAAGFPVDERSMHGETALKTILDRAPHEIHIVRALLAAGAQVNYPENEESQLLFVAIDAGADITTVQALLDHGADLALAMRQHPLLHKAVSLARPGVVKLLLDKGVDPNASGHGDPRSPLQLALAARDTTTACLLVDASADVHAIEAGASKLMLAVSNPDKGLVERLLARGVDPTWVNRQGKSARSYAQADHLPLLESAIEAWMLKRATPPVGKPARAPRL